MSTTSFAEGLVGTILDDRYRLDAVLGEGGMGSVFRAHHLAMDRRVAVKLLKPHLTQDQVATQRFLREARATLKVDSPHAVKVLDFGITPHGDYYMALEYLDGRTVQRELEVDGPFAPTRVLHIARQALHALGSAHRRGLVHRDLKPDNMLLMRVGGDPDHAKLLDFGVAKLMEGTASSEQSQLALTAAGVVFGTPEYMSPEQACGHPLDGRSDLYSLGATMFAMLTGCGLFEGQTALEWLSHHVRTPPPHLAMIAPELAAYPGLDAMLQRCLAKHRDLRPRSAEELDQQLAQLEHDVRRGGGAAAVPRTALGAPTPSSASSYLEALPADSVDPGETLPPPPVGAEPPPRSLLPTSTVATIQARRRGLPLALGALAVAAVMALAIGVAVRHRPSRRGSITTPMGRGPAAATEVATDAAPAAAKRSANDDVDAGLDPRAANPANQPIPNDAAPETAAAHLPPDARPRPRSRASAAKVHLDRAEAARRADNRLRQLAEADLALKADPRNVRATYLLADALIKGGDLDRGCAYLRALGRNQLAQARARTAGCPPPGSATAQGDSGP